MRRRDKLLQVAHRGDPGHAPENTLASFRSAIRKGAEAIEADVRRTADGVWVAFHDPTLKRTTGMPLISQVLALGRAKRVEVFLDVKESRGERELFGILRRSGWLRRTRILAGDTASLVRWRRILPARHPLYWVTGFRQPLTERRIRQGRRLGLSGFVAYRRWVTSGAVKRVHQAGLELYVWTARTTTQIKHFARLGVNGVMSEVWPHHLRSDRSDRRSAKGGPATAVGRIRRQGSG